MSCYNTVERQSGNVYIRPIRLEKAGDFTPGHTHNFDHTTIIFKGAVRVVATSPDGSTRTADFPFEDSFLVKADVLHEITALEDDTVYWCVYSHRDAQGEVIQEYTGFDKAYL